MASLTAGCDHSIFALQLALGSLPDEMRVGVESDIGVSAKTVGDLRNKVTVREFGDHNSDWKRSPEHRQGQQG
jgi:hypothetical protein